MSADMPVWLLVVALILVGFLIYILKNWRAEYKFYANSNWNYSVDNPGALPIYKGEDSPKTEENRLSNRERMSFGYPFATFVITSILCGCLFFIFKIYTCPSDDLTKCGITVKNGGVTFGSP